MTVQKDNATRPVDQVQLDELLGRFVADLGATISAGNVILGDRLGLYRALAEAGPLTSTELAAYTGTAERYVREWLAGQAAGRGCQALWRGLSCVWRRRADRITGVDCSRGGSSCEPDCGAPCASPVPR